MSLPGSCGGTRWRANGWIMQRRQDGDFVAAGALRRKSVGSTCPRRGMRIFILMLVRGRCRGSCRACGARAGSAGDGGGGHCAAAVQLCGGEPELRMGMDGEIAARPVAPTCGGGEGGGGDVGGVCDGGGGDGEAKMCRMLPEPVHRAIQFAAETLGRKPAAAIALEDLAGAGSVTAKHLCRLFREHVEMSPMGAVLALRLRHAVALMSRTDFKLERIARECGFATSFHFSRRFRDAYGKCRPARCGRICWRGGLCRRRGCCGGRR